jgi:hypothetical protein
VVIRKRLPSSGGVWHREAGAVATVVDGRAVATGQFDGDDVTAPDLRVGQIRALRTFRLSEYGYLRRRP